MDESKRSLKGISLPFGDSAKPYWRNSCSDDAIFKIDGKKLGFRRMKNSVDDLRGF